MTRRRVLVAAALAAVLLLVTVSLATATEVAPPGTGACRACHPLAHPAGWQADHGAVIGTSLSSYAPCARCHRTADCDSCHKGRY